MPTSNNPLHGKPWHYFEVDKPPREIIDQFQRRWGALPTYLYYPVDTAPLFVPEILAKVVETEHAMGGVYAGPIPARAAARRGVKC